MFSVGCFKIECQESITTLSITQDFCRPPLNIAYWKKLEPTVPRGREGVRERKREEEEEVGRRGRRGKEIIRHTH